MSDHSSSSSVPASPQQTLREARQQLKQNLQPFLLAYSADGVTFGFQAPLSAPILTGGYVRITTDEGTQLLGQVMRKDITEREGPSMSIEGDAGFGIGIGDSSIAQTSFQIRMRRVDGEGVLLCRLTPEGIADTGRYEVFEDADISPASDEEIERYLHARTGKRASLGIGTLRESATADASLIATGFDRHTFLCGQSGSGKTYALGVMLERLLLETNLRMVIIDPNSDFVHLAEMRSFDAMAAQRGVTMTPETYEHLRSRYEAATRGVRVIRPTARGQKAPNALRVRFSELQPMVQGLVLRIDPLEDMEEYSSMRRIISRLGKTRYSLAELRDAAAADLSSDGRRLALRIDNLGVATWDIWAEEDDTSLSELVVDDDWRALVLDVGGFSKPAEKSLLAAAVLGQLWANRDQREPVLIVADEAHNVCAQEATDPIQKVATDRAILIAGEGRKYGRYLLMATQRPQKLHENVLSQCDNLVLMRMNSAGDLAHLANTFSFVPVSLIEQAARFGQGESLVAGKLVPSPMFVRFGGRVSREGGSDVPTTWADSP
jgi:DNA helicase HerA-like ATPase